MINNFKQKNNFGAIGLQKGEVQTAESLTKTPFKKGKKLVQEGLMEQEISKSRQNGVSCRGAVWQGREGAGELNRLARHDTEQ